MVLGCVVDYVLGTAWFMAQTHMTLGAALAACVFPFLIGDGLKIILASIIGPIVRKRWLKAGGAKHVL